MARENIRLTRRRLLAAGGVVGAAAAGGYGRFAVGDAFEEHVAATLGTSVALATQLTGSVRAGMSSVEYDARAAGFLAATTFPGSELMPANVRERAIHSFIGPMLLSSAANLRYLGARDSRGIACRGLLRG